MTEQLQAKIKVTTAKAIRARDAGDTPTAKSHMAELKELKA